MFQWKYRAPLVVFKGRSTIARRLELSYDTEFYLVSLSEKLWIDKGVCSSSQARKEVESVHTEFLQKLLRIEKRNIDFRLHLIFFKSNNYKHPSLEVIQLGEVGVGGGERGIKQFSRIVKCFEHRLKTALLKITNLIIPGKASLDKPISQSAELLTSDVCEDANSRIQGF